MDSRQAKRQCDRATDELRRGYSIGLKNNDIMVSVQAAERALGTSGTLPAMLVLPEPRAQFLGISQPGAVSVALQAGEEALLSALLFEPLPAFDLSRAKPSTDMQKIALGLVKESGFLPAALLKSGIGAQDFWLSAEDARLGMMAHSTPLMMSAAAQLPLKLCESTRVITFRDARGDTHLALLMGQVEKETAPLVRLHSSCLTGDLLGSMRCDCGDQLHLALEAIAAEGAGILLYLAQEGRSIGLANKMHAYRLQDGGLDTVEANRALGFEDDERDFTLAARMLAALEVDRIRLLTNNPRKPEVLTSAGIVIEKRVPLKAHPTAQNKDYLAAKAAKMRHQLN